MCGLVYSQSFDGSPVNNAILQQFDLQRSRGTQGFGLFDGMKKNIVRAANENKILKWLVNYDSDLIMFHHRFPTSTINVKRAAHPFSTKGYFGDTQYILVHNGGVYNAKTLKPKHEKLGIKYHSQLQDGTFNDSESLLWDFALTMEGKQDELKAYGGIAFICVKLVKGKLSKLYFARNNSKPLNMDYSKGGLSLSSEGDGEPITAHTLHTFNYELKRLTKKKFYVHASDPDYVYIPPKTYTNTCGYGGYDDYKWSDSQQMLIPAEKVNEGEVDTLVMEYIMRAHGVFETAYWMAEWDYGVMLEDSEFENGFVYTTDIATMERVLEEIERDPEYINETSVSSLWGEIVYA